MSYNRDDRARRRQHADRFDDRAERSRDHEIRGRALRDRARDADHARDLRDARYSRNNWEV